MQQKAYDFYNEKMHAIIDRMMVTRPKKDVVYRPFTDQPYHTRHWSYDRCVNLNTVFGKHTWHGDYAFVSTNIKCPFDTDIAMFFRGATAYRVNGGEWIEMCELPKWIYPGNYEEMHNRYQVTTHFHEGINEVVFKVVAGCNNSMALQYLVSSAHFPGMWTNAYHICLHDCIPVEEYKDEVGYAISELCKYGSGKTFEECKTVYPKPSQSDAVIDFNKLYADDKGDYALAYTTAKCDTKLNIKKKSPLTVYVNGVKSKVGASLKAGDKVIVVAKRSDKGWGFESKINDCVFPSEIDSNRKDGTHWLLLGAFADDSCPKITFKDTYKTADGGECYFRFADGVTYLRPFLETYFFGQWFYALMVGQYGIHRASMIDNKYYDYFRDGIMVLADYYDYMKYDHKLFDDVPFLRATIGIKCFDNSGTMCMNMCDLYLEEKDEENKAKLLRVIKDLRDIAMTKIFRLDDGTFYRKASMTMWADDMFMSMPFLSRVAIVTKDNKFFDEVIKQLKLYHQKLWMPSEGCFAHIYYPELGRNNRVPWGRGNGWVYVGFAEAIEHLPKDYPGRDEIIELYKEMAKGLIPLQAESGRWRQVLNIPESYEETSCTALFSISLAKMIKAGVIDRETYLPIIKKGVDALLKYSVDEQYNVLGVCKGSSCKDGPEYYINLGTVFNDDHGIGVVIYAICELMDLIKDEPEEE